MTTPAEPNGLENPVCGDLLALARSLRVFAAFAMITGICDVALGVRLLMLSGSPLSAGAGDPLLDSQLRLLGAIWAGFGATRWWVADDLRQRRVPMYILCGTVFVGGIGRVASAVLHGAGPPVLTAFIFVEIAGPPLVVFLAQRSTGTRG